MSCYAKHPDIEGIACWHGPGHSGDHGKEHRSWPNAEDPLRKKIAQLTALLRDLPDLPVGAGTYCTYPLLEGPCAWVPGRAEACWQHRRRDALAASRLA